MNAVRRRFMPGLQLCHWRLFLGYVIAGGLAVMPVTAIDAPCVSGLVRGQAWFSPEETAFGALYGEWNLKLAGETGPVFYQTDLRVREGLFYDQHETQLELKEAYVGYRSGPFETSVGKRVFGWGRVDGYNPTNNLAVYDYFRLSDHPDDQKLGVFQWHLNYRIVEGSDLTLVWQPLFTPSVYRYELFDLGAPVILTEPRMPTYGLAQSNLAFRWNVDYPAVGFSLSYFNGYDPYHGVNLVDVALQPSVQLTYQPDYYRKQTVGADLALPLGAFILRAEAAYNFTKGYETKVFVPKPALNAVLGWETVLAGTTTLVQYQLVWTPDWKALVVPMLTDPYNPEAQYAYAMATARYETALFNQRIMKQEKASQHALMLSMQRNFAYETLSMGFTGQYDLTTEEYLLRPELAWRCADALTLKGCALWMKGPEGSLYGYAGKVLGGVCLGLTVTY